MQTKDKQLHPINICQKLFNFFVHNFNFLSPGLKRLTSVPPTSQSSSTHIPVHLQDPNSPLLANPHQDEVARPNYHDTIHVHFKHGEDDDDPFESWTPLDVLGSSIHEETKDETNPGQVRRRGVGGTRKMASISDGRDDREEDKKGKNKKGNTASSQGERLTLAIDPSDEPDLDGLILRPHLLSVDPNINEKSADFIKTRMAAMTDSGSSEDKH